MCWIKRVDLLNLSSVRFESAGVRERRELLSGETDFPHQPRKRENCTAVKPQRHTLDLKISSRCHVGAI